MPPPKSANISSSISATAATNNRGNTILTVTAIFFFLLVTWLVTSTIGSREQRTHMRHQGDGYPMAHRQRLNTLGELESFEGWESDLTRSSQEMCWDIEAKNESLRRSAAEESLKHANSAKLSADALVRKVQIFRGKGSLKGSGVGPRVWCMTLGAAERPGESESTQRLWGKKCDTNYLYTDATTVPGVDPKSVVTIKPIGGNGENNGWQRLRSVLQHALTHPTMDDYDFFLFAQDSSLVFVENLRKMLMEPQLQWFSKMQIPTIIGHRMVAGSGIPFVSGASFVINKAAMKIISFAIDAESCKPKQENVALDLSLAECLGDFGVFFSDSVDEFGEDRMHAFNPDLLVGMATNHKGTPWYKDYHAKELPTGMDATSQYTVQFHYMTPHLAHTVYEKVYR